MSEISGAIISITLVMAAVFIPVSFISGSAGVFYKQFGLTLAIAILLSAVNALTLSPALCAVFLKPHEEEHGEKKNFMKRFFIAFNAAFEATTNKYKSSIAVLARYKWVPVTVIIIFAGIFIYLMETMPKSFVPSEDTGAIMADIALPPSASEERTAEITQLAEELVRKIPEVKSVLKVNGRGMISGAGSNYGMLIIKLHPWAERKNADQSVEAIVGKLFGLTSGIRDAKIIFFIPPALQGFGISSGFEFQLQDRTGGDINSFYQIAQNFLAELNKRPEIQYASTSFNPNFPQYQIDVNVPKVKEAGFTVNDVLNAMQGYYGGVYASNFNQFGKQFRVMYQASPEYRDNPESLQNIYIRNSKGEMAPLSGFITMERVYGPQSINRFNLYTSININGSPNPGFSSGDAIKAIEEVAARHLPLGYSYEYSGMTREEIAAGGQTMLIFLLVVMFVYLLLSAQYESYILPLAVLLSLPIGLAGIYLFASIFNISNSIYLQITLVMMVGLLAKNAILIVEFALERRRRGFSIIKAALEGSKARLRPILMTSFAFIFGLLPLMLAKGAGAAGNRSIGTGAIGGMLIGTVLGIFVIPVLFIIFQSVQEKITGTPRALNPEKIVD